MMVDMMRKDARKLIYSIGIHRAASRRPVSRRQKDVCDV